jgi:hypothetical protein
MNGKQEVSPRDVVIFRTHFWDEFARRQFDRLRRQTEGIDLFVLVDETGGPVTGIQHGHVVRVTEQAVIALGLPRAGEGNLLWFNGDYPLYFFMTLFPCYDHYVQIEYDVLVTANLQEMLRRMRTEEIDFVGLSKGEEPSTWPWRGSCAGVYGPHYRHQLICMSAFSRRALVHLFGKRREHARMRRSGHISCWPMCEAFIATELANGKFRSAELSEFGDTTAYDHWPPYLEADIEKLPSDGFIHPVLDEPRYISSMFKYRVGLKGYLAPDSLLHRKLRRLPAPLYLQTLATSFAEKVARTLRRPKAPRSSPGRAA